MRQREVSRHEVAVFAALQAAGSEWLSSAELARRAEVSSRTARAHATKFVRLGFAEHVELSPAWRFRLLPGAGDEEAQLHRKRLIEAAEVFGMKLA